MEKLSIFSFSGTTENGTILTGLNITDIAIQGGNLLYLHNDGKTSTVTSRLISILSNHQTKLNKETYTKLNTNATILGTFGDGFVTFEKDAAGGRIRSMKGEILWEERSLDVRQLKVDSMLANQ